MTNMADAVARGAAALDDAVPDWASKVRGAMVSHRFDMANWDHCVAGTLEIVKLTSGSGYPVIAFNGTILKGYGQAMRYGFATDDDEWDELEEHWKIEIDKRLGSIEPTDDEIYNGPGVEGGIAYSTDEPGSLGENDWRL